MEVETRCRAARHNRQSPYSANVELALRDLHTSLRRYLRVVSAGILDEVEHLQRLAESTRDFDPDLLIHIESFCQHARNFIREGDWDSSAPRYSSPPPPLLPPWVAEWSRPAPAPRRLRNTEFLTRTASVGLLLIALTFVIGSQIHRTPSLELQALKAETAELRKEVRASTAQLADTRDALNRVASIASLDSSAAAEIERLKLLEKSLQHAHGEIARATADIHSSTQMVARTTELAKENLKATRDLRSTTLSWPNLAYYTLLGCFVLFLVYRRFA